MNTVHISVNVANGGNRQLFVLESEQAQSMLRRWRECCGTEQTAYRNHREAQFEPMAGGGALPFMRVLNGEARAVVEEPEPVSAMANARVMV